MFCKNCGGDIQPGEKFCSHCGAQVVPEAQPSSQPSSQPASQPASGAQSAPARDPLDSYFDPYSNSAADPDAARRIAEENARRAQAVKDDQARTMGIVGLVLAFLVPIAGLIVSIVALTQNRTHGTGRTCAIIGLVFSVLPLLFAVILMVVILGGAAAL